MKSEEEKMIDMVMAELARAKKVYPDADARYPWKHDRKNLFKQCAVVACEAGEALQAASKFRYNESGDIESIVTELIQTMSTSMRVLKSINRYLFFIRSEK